MEEIHVVRKRPLGVTIVAILMTLGGFMGTLGGIGLLAFPSELSSILETNDVEYSWLDSVSLLLGSYGVTIGIAFLVVAVGLFAGMGWSWTGAIVLMYVSIAEEIVMIVLGISYGYSMILAAIFLYYLYRPRVKLFFGKMPLTM